MGVCDRVLVIDIVCVGVTELVAVDVQSQGCVLGDVDSRVTELVAVQTFMRQVHVKTLHIQSICVCKKMQHARSRRVHKEMVREYIAVAGFCN